MIVEAKNLIVVSDLHLGHERANPKAFTEFLKWVDSLGKKPVKYNLSQDFSKEFVFPEKLIFLGDVFELYDPRDGDSRNIARDTIPVLQYLSRMPCEKVYVTGNHDDSMDVLDGLEIVKSMTRAYSRHFPPDPFSDSVKVGNAQYLFLHGHQFDKKIEQIGKFGTIGPYIVFQLQGISRTLFGLGGWGSLILSGFLGMTYVLCNGSLFANALLYSILVISPFWASQLLWRMIIPLVRRKAKPTELEIDTILKKRYYKPEKDLIQSDFVVFGHTHFPDIHDEKEVVALLENGRPLPKTWKPKGLVNTGGWFREAEAAYYTFVYIDAAHIILLRWNPQEEKPELVHERSYIEVGPENGG